jgi:two-component system, OmpR family, alkaline phosphatase synthesis response regulator PhoP
MIEGTRPKPAPIRVLVVDDDRRVLELLEVAFSTQGYEVLTAVDGDDAYRKAVTEQPDLIVLDVRLPKRSGFEVCEALRRERGERAAPVILVSAAGETESRVHGLSAGADDFLAKPFSPKELLARSRRLLARAKEAREMRQRGVELERELARARDEVRRSHVETRREQRLRELAFGVGRDLARTLDLDTLTRRFLGATHTRLGVGTLGLLLPGRDEAVFELAGARGEAVERLAGLTLARDGALARLLAALGRPVRRRELEGVLEVRPELPALVAAGLVLAAPLVGPDGLEGVLVTDERRDGLEPQPHDLELVSGLCELVAGALRNARRYRVPLERAVELLASVTGDAESAPLRAEAAALVERAARATLLAPRPRGLLTHVVALGDALDERSPRAALERLEAGDVTGWVTDLIALVERARVPAAPDAAGEPEWARAALLVAFARRLTIARVGGETLEAAAARALESLDGALDGDTRQALEAAVRETVLAARPAA